MATGSFPLDYFALVFSAACGVFQLAAACNKFPALLLLPGRRPSFLLGLALMVAAFAWFFLSAPRNVPDITQGLNGNEQAGYFFAGSGAALAFTLLASSLRNLSLGAGPGDPAPGMDALRGYNYLRALHRTLRSSVRRWMRSSS